MLWAQLHELKQRYTNCLAYRVFTSDPGDGHMQHPNYDRALPEPELLNLISQRIEAARTRGQPVGELAAHEYLKWTFDEDNGPFALMHRQ